ncbi:MAG: AtpZ/AtpI family protein [Pseudomonadota bacterium]
MTDDNPEDLSERIRRAQNARKPKDTSPSESPEPAVNAGGLALRYGTEFAANVIVGLGLGLLIDYIFGTTPWGLLIMLGFGLAAAILGVIRAYNKINAEIAELTASADDRD